ncbi:MAG: MFS transporter, partial [Bacteroidota bacterium]
DQWGRIPVMIVGSTFGMIVCILYPALASVYGFLTLRFMHGFATGFKPTGTAAYVADIVPADRRGEAMGIVSFCGSTGMALGPSIGSWIFIEYDINTLFYISGGASILSILILIGMKETLTNRRTFNVSMLRVGRHEILEPTVIPASVVMILSMIAFGTLLTLSPDFSKHLGITNKGLFFSFYTGSSMLSRLFGGRLSDRIGRVAVLRVSMLIIFVSMVFTGFATNPTWLFIGALIYGIGNGLTNPTLFAWAVDLCPEQFRGRGIATLYIFLEVGIGIGSLVSGSVFQQDPSRFPIIFAVSGGFSVIGYAYLMLNRRKPAYV